MRTKRPTAKGHPRTAKPTTAKGSRRSGKLHGRSSPNRVRAMKGNAPAIEAMPSARTQKGLISKFMGAIGTEQWDRILAPCAPASGGGKLFALMHDPQFDGWSLERLCLEAGLEFRDLVRLVSDHSLGTALMESSKHVAGVVEGLAADGTPIIVTCDLCLGLRADGAADDEPTIITVPHPRVEGAKLDVPCPKCGGVGKVRHGGDARKAETFLRLHGALADEAGPGVVLNQQFNFGAAHAQGVHRGQQLLAEGRRMTITARRIDENTKTTSSESEKGEKS